MSEAACAFDYGSITGEHDGVAPGKMNLRGAYIAAGIDVPGDNSHQDVAVGRLEHRDALPLQRTVAVVRKLHFAFAGVFAQVRSRAGEGEGGDLLGKIDGAAGLVQLDGDFAQARGGESHNSVSRTARPTLYRLGSRQAFIATSSSKR